MRDSVRRFLATVIAVCGGVALAMLTVDSVHTWETRHRCGYRFDWSRDQCTRLEGHKGDHY